MGVVCSRMMYMHMGLQYNFDSHYLTCLYCCRRAGICLEVDHFKLKTVCLGRKHKIFDDIMIEMYSGRVDVGF